jgi:hypothetical protein
MIFIKAIRNSIYRNAFIIGLLFMYILLRIAVHINSIVDNRIGVQLHDPIIAILPPPANYSTPIFLLTYGIIMVMMYYGFFHKPIILIQYAYGLIIINIFRCIAIWNIPLEPPIGIILLHDIFIESTTSNGLPVAKDLFFSGHAASTLLAALLIARPNLRKGAIVAAFFMAFLMLNQRVHYSIDIFGGWLMAYLCQRLVQHFFPIWMPQIATL